MNYNTQNAKIASITEKTLIVGIDVGSETHYAMAVGCMIGSMIINFFMKNKIRD